MTINPRPPALSRLNTLPPWDLAELRLGDQRAKQNMPAEIVHVVSSLRLGGAERCALDLCRVQHRRGHNARVISFGTSGDTLVSEAKAASTPCVSLADVSGAAQRFQALVAAVAPRRVSALHVHSPWCLKPLAPLLPFVKGRIIYTRHGAHAYDSLVWKALHRYAHPFIDHITFVSEEGKRVHEAAYGSAHCQYHILENGADLGVPQQVMRAPSEPVRVGCVGRLVELKGQQRVLEAVADIVAERPGAAEVHIFGDGPDRSALESWGAEHMPGAVHFHGAVANRDQVYPEVDVLAVASRMEGLSLAIMEAMARAIPVIATDVGGNSRLVVDGFTGLLVPLGDNVALRAALARVIHDRELRAQLGRSARSHIETCFSLETTADRFDALYASQP